MVNFIEGGDDDDEKSSRWSNLMKSTRQKFRELWSGGEKIPERDE